MTSKFWSTVTSNANIALKLGSSKQGKQLLASVAANTEKNINQSCIP